MKKLIKFQPNAQTYYDIAEDKYEDGDFESAVHYFFKSYRQHRDVNSLLALGETYCEMGEPEEGLKYLFMALDAEPDDTEICHSIAQCFLDLDDEETAFFYFQPRMTVKRFRNIMEESERDSENAPRIRVLEKNDDMIVSIAVKLFDSGDITYAREMLLTIKPDSDYYVSSCNLLSLSALELEKPDEALLYAEKALKTKENIDSRCNMMLAYYMLGDTEMVNKLMEAIESQKMDLAGHKTVSLAYIRMGDAERAIRHLEALRESERYNRDAMVSYALSTYNLGRTQDAKQLIVTAGKMYPDDIAIKEIAAAINRGDKLTLFPLIEDETAAIWLSEIDDKLVTAKDSGDDFYADESFKDKVKWLFQSRFTLRQSRCAMILGRFRSWQGFFREQLLDNYMDLSAKKVCLFALILSGGCGSIGIVIEGMYSRLKVKYPGDMDEVFRTAYCLTFASFAFSDSCFEDRLCSAAKKLLKKYNALDDKTPIKSEDALAAAIFFAAKHNQIKDTVNCAHLFGCNHDEMLKYTDYLDIKTDKIP